MKNLKLNKYLLLTILSLLLWNCKDAKKMPLDPKTILGKQVELLGDSLMKNRNTGYSNPLTKELKILKVMNVSCGDCLQEFADWKKYINLLDTSRVGVVFLCQSIDQFMVFEDINNAQLHFTYPYFEDRDNTFSKGNKFLDKWKYETFLLDASNKIVCVGNPTLSKEIANRYANKIRIKEELIVPQVDPPGVIIKRKENIVSFKFLNNTVWKDEHENVISKKRKNELLKTGNYYMEHDSRAGIVVLKNKYK